MLNGIYFFLAQAAFLLWAAAPLLLIVLLGGLAMAGVGALTRALGRRSVAGLLGGAMVLALTGWLGYLGFVFFKGSPGKMPRVEVADPRPQWRGPLPAVFINGVRYDRVSPIALIKSKSVKRVIQHGRTGATQQMIRDAATYQTMWEELRLREDPGCQAAYERAFRGPNRVEEEMRCIEKLPLVLTGRMEEPYWIELVDRSESANTETHRFYVVDGSSRQLALTCHAEWPHPRHPLAGILAWRESSAITQGMRNCRNEAFRGRLVSALARKGPG